MENEQVLQQYEDALKESQINVNAAKLSQSQQEIMLQNEEKGLASEQLDLTDILSNMENLLRCFELKSVDGVQRWMRPKDNDLIVLTDYGVSYFMWMLNAYLTKNTLLSNYDEEQINGKMEDFSITLADDVFMEYDKMFLYPTIDDCKNEIRRRIKHRVDIKMFANELIGKESDKGEIESLVLKEMENRIEREMETIKQQKIKNKLKRFESLIRMVQDTVHSAYMRAWKGQERTTLRQHFHISENKGSVALPQNTGDGFNPLSMFKRKR